MGDGLEGDGLETGDGSLSPSEKETKNRPLSPNPPLSPKNLLYMLHKRDTRSIIKLNEMPFCI